jgi:hypothetical protein
LEAHRPTWTRIDRPYGPVVRDPEVMSHGDHPISYADLVIDRFQNWPLTERRADCPPGRALCLHGLQVVHLHRSDLAEVFLTPQVVCRLGTALTASGRVDIPVDAGWVQVHLDTDSDLSLLESLVSLAIQANDPASRLIRRPMTTCPMSAPRVSGTVVRPRGSAWCRSMSPSGRP